MVIPKVEFRYSPIYDECFRKFSKKTNYPSKDKILKFISNIKRIWVKEENKVLNELSKVSHLKWDNKPILCYVVGRCIPFSDPLTLPVMDEYPDYFIDNLLHELIHILLTQKDNLKKSKKAWQYFNRKYKKESYTTKIHVPTHAFHKHIYLKLYNNKRLERDIKLISKLPSYKKSWDIVNKEGYKEVINNFTKRLK